MTDADDFFATHLQRTRVMAILRGHGPSRTLELCRRAWALGIELVEIPVQSDGDLDALRDAVTAGRDHGRLVGAGTVTSHGAASTGWPASAPPSRSRPASTRPSSPPAGPPASPHLPGVATATEIHRAMRLGLRWLKAFPAVALGPSWFAAMRGPFPEVRLVATGGVDAGNAAGFLDAGAAAASLGARSPMPTEDELRRLAVSDRGN